MSTVIHSGSSSTNETDYIDHFSALAPPPTSIGETGLSESFLGDLVCKHLLNSGVLSLFELVERVALTGKVLQDLMQFLRAEARVEVLAGTDNPDELRYSLTNRGRQTALDAMARNGYIGPAPVTLQQYASVVRKQTIHSANVTKSDMRAAFSDVVLKETLLDQLGPSLNSGRAIFIYGQAGTGKTYITQRLAKLFRDAVLIPHAIAVNDTVIAVFNPVKHKPIEQSQAPRELVFTSRYDDRWVSCERPVLISGGELHSDMLDVQLEPLVKEYRAPLQLLANNGVFIIDDMGRQRISPAEVFNRWIVPLEEQIDYLSLGSGRHFSVPFDLVLVFSTNINPTELADEAFLRRIGYKIEFGPLERDQYETIWREVCRAKQVVCDQSVLDFAIEDLHAKTQTPLLPCHPRDLLSIAVDQLTYQGEPRVLSRTHISWAWHNYFVGMDVEPNEPSRPIISGESNHV